MIGARVDELATRERGEGKTLYESAEQPVAVVAVGSSGSKSCGETKA